ncbi:unnamed protein product [Heligmosomoides polygyrus]|uniref:PlsC domain-containing protein n=1 Tax=Heligmosomoides polygyrus TaxID=6339 RepID=A0A183FJM2_HELPZ|nr:unnamed protein product [Heligmosomoides polygyrus]
MVLRIFGFTGAAYFVVMTAIVVPVACVSTVVLLFPLIYLNLPLFNYLENHLCKLVNNHWVSASVHCGLNIVEYGCDIRAYAEKRCLFLANHLGLIDHFVLMQSLHNKGRWMWVIYNIWKYTPLGVMWSAHGNFFINGGKARKVALLSSFKKHLCNTFYKFDYRWIVMYPEGSRLFLIKDSCARFAEKIGLPALRHCGYPRTGAAHAVLDVLGPATSAQKLEAGPAVEYIIDATLGYPKGAVPNIVGEWPSSDGRVCVHYDVYKVDPEWANETNLQAFLYKRYQAKVSPVLSCEHIARNTILFMKFILNIWGCSSEFFQYYYSPPNAVNF